MDPSQIHIIRQITCSDASAIFEVDLGGQKYALKLFHDNGDPGYTEKGRDLNRFRCELNAYEKLLTSGVCVRGFVPKFYGYIDRMDPAFHPAFQHYARDKLKPRAILLEYLPNAVSLDCVNYSDALYPQAIKGMQEIHRAGVHHQDIYPKNLLLVRGNPDRLVWIDFDVATTFTDFGPEQLARCDYEIALVKGFAEALVWVPLLSTLEAFSVLTNEYREMTRLRDSRRIQNFIKGF
jgi:serine/threonine protein kinase